MKSSNSFVSKVNYLTRSTVSTGLGDKVVKSTIFFSSICFRRRSGFRMNAEMHSNLFWTSSGVTRVKGQPGQLTNKQQLSREVLSVVGWEREPLTETHHRSLLDFHI